MGKDENGLPDGVNADSPNPGERRSNDEGIITESAGGVKQAPPAALPEDPGGAASLARENDGLVLTITMPAPDWDAAFALFQQQAGPHSEIKVRGHGKDALVLFMFAADGPDVLRILAPEGAGSFKLTLAPDAPERDAQLAALFNESAMTLGMEWRTTLDPREDGIHAMLAGQDLRLSAPDWTAGYKAGTTREKLLQEIARTDGEAGPLTADAYPVHTSQEWTALEQAAADGKTQTAYREVNGQLVHQRQGSPFFVRMTPRDEEPLDALVTLTQSADANSAIGLLYVSELLAPAQPLARGAYAGGRVNIDDVIAKIGLDPRSTKERRQMREWAYKAVVEFGARAEVVGRRAGRTYKDHDGKEIDTYIAVTPWAMMNPERPVQPGLFGDVPVSVELVASREWTALTTAPATRQFLPCGEVLGSIPPRQAAGAWARVVGLAFMNFKRRHPTGRLQPTRRQMLTEFTPAKSPPIEILEGNDPGRAVRYWRDALRILVERGILADAGEAAQPDAPAGYGWQEAWLNAKVDLQPGALLLDPVKDRALARAEKALPKRRRPRKRKAQN